MTTKNGNPAMLNNFMTFLVIIPVSLRGLNSWVLLLITAMSSRLFKESMMFNIKTALGPLPSGSKMLSFKNADDPAMKILAFLPVAIKSFLLSIFDSALSSLFNSSAAASGGVFSSYFGISFPLK